jgi:sugar lactone lactonase YvrE
VDDEGYFYVSDTEKHEVRRYRVGGSRGTVVAGGHGQGRRLHQLNNPTYIFVGSDQSVYVSDSYNDRVMKWKKGAKVGVIVAGGNGKVKTRTQLDCPAGLLVDHLGRVYVADHWNSRVMRWDKGAEQGEIIAGNKYLPGESEKHLNGPEGLAFDQDGNLYVADSYNHRIQRFAIQTN